MATRTTIPTDVDAPPPGSEEERRLPTEEGDALRALLRSWRETTDPEDSRDQRETAEILMKAFGERRPWYRRIFR